MNLSGLHLHWRQSKYKGSTYRSYSLARAYREDGKNKREIILKLGKLDDEEADRWKSLLRAFKSDDAVVTTVEDIVVERNLDYLDVAVANEIWDEWRLDDVFPAKGRKAIDPAKVARILVLNRCLEPCSKHSVVTWFKRTALRFMLGISDESFNASRIYRELDHIEDSKDIICSYIFAKIQREHPASLRSVFYDLSSSIFHGSKCILVEWGRAKEGYRNHVVISIAVTNQGIPFYWDIHEGGTSEMKIFQEFTQKIKDKFSIKDITLGFDRGMVSDANLKRLEKGKYKYVTALDKNQIKQHTDFDFRELHHFDPIEVRNQVARKAVFKMFDNKTFYLEAGVKDCRRYILGFNTELFKAQTEIRNKNIDNFIKYIDELNDYLKHEAERPNDTTLYKKVRTRLSKFNLSAFISIDFKPTKVRRFHPELEETIRVNSYRVTYSIDHEEKKKYSQLDGCWMLVTNHTEQDVDDHFHVTAKQVIQTYRDKYIVEDTFRDVKAFIDISPTYVWTEKHVKAHYTICALAHLINQSLALKLKEHGEERSAKSAKSAFLHLRECKLNDLRIKSHNLQHRRLTDLNETQKSLLNQLKMTHLVDKH